MAPRTKGTTAMADKTTDPQTGAEIAAKAKRKPQGPRKPSPIYAFAKVTDAAGAVIPGAKVELAFTTRNPHKMAEYFPQSNTNGESFLILTPEG